AIVVANSSPINPVVFFDVSIGGQEHVVFGKIIDGLLVMRKIENVPTGPNNNPKLPVVISQCGE
ncbi:hypothetical protein A6R68_22683, partial [Neotoma lepida]